MGRTRRSRRFGLQPSRARETQIPNTIRDAVSDPIVASIAPKTIALVFEIGRERSKTTTAECLVALRVSAERVFFFAVLVYLSKAAPQVVRLPPAYLYRFVHHTVV